MSMFGNLLDELKKPLYYLVKKDSEGMESIGRKLGWDWLVNEGQKNQQNPGRAVGKAAQAAATWYLGGPAWSGAGEGATAASMAAQQAAATSAYSGLGATAASAAPALGQTAASVAAQGAKTAGEIAAEEAAKQAAMEAAGQTVGSAVTQQPGMFNMIPGVNQGSAQHLALLEQNAGLGGSASDLTAQAAKGALGKQSFLDSIINTGKLDLAGMNDPSVWLDRLGRNADRFAAQNGKSMGRELMMQSMGGGQQQQPGQRPPPPQQAQQSAPPPDAYASPSGGGGDEIELLAAKLGVSRAELEAMLDKMGRRA